MASCVLATAVVLLVTVALSSGSSWSSWGSWGSCLYNSGSCGSGYHHRTRSRKECKTTGFWPFQKTTCSTKYSYSKKYCYRCCKVNCSWNSWGSWGSCSRCGSTGTQTRRRTKSRSESCGGYCYGSYTSTRSCNICCKVNCSWNSWSSWGSCSKSCGSTGTQTRKRTKSRSQSCGGTCSGSYTSTRSCYTCCKVNCSWNSWGSWGSCSKTCGSSGTQTRKRTKSRTESCGGTCSGSSTSTRSCPNTCCKVNCSWNSWGSWGSCSKTCGSSGTQTRKRTKYRTESCGGTCSGSSSSSQSCPNTCCPRDCRYNSWSSWSSCDYGEGKTCGTGSQSRSRSYSQTAYCGGKSCSGPSKETRTCSKCCPRDCVYGNWTSWSPCNYGSGKSCGTGSQSRTREIVQTAYCGGKACNEPLNETQTCSKCCPRDCVYGKWSSWSSCNYGSGKTCGTGSQSRTRDIVQTAYCGGKACSGHSRETRTCHTCCPVDCFWRSWEKWSACSKSCGPGVQTRTRSEATSASCGGKPCSGSSKVTRACNTQCCPRSCSWSRWCDWSSCTKSCGGGLQYRTRHTTTAASCGGSCIGQPVEKRSCNNDKCAPGTITKIACEHTTLSLSCPKPRRIKVISASYGRSDHSTCPHKDIRTTRCHASTSLSCLKAACQGKSSCSIKASNAVFSDPCEGTFKYLKVTIQCY